MRLKQLDDVASRVLSQDLTAALALDQCSAKRHVVGAEFSDQSIEIVNCKLEPIPATRFRHAARVAGTSGPGCVQQQRQIPTAERRESRGWMHLHVEAQSVPVELHGRINIIDDIANTDSHYAFPLLASFTLSDSTVS